MTILLVDDEMLVRNWLSMLISRLGRSDVTTISVSNAADALLCCQRQKVDLVITDITMPQMSGLELLQVLSEKHPEIKTAVLSAYDDYKYIREVFKLGALDYILKSEMKLEDIEALMNKMELFSQPEEINNADGEKLLVSAQNKVRRFLAGELTETAFLADTTLKEGCDSWGLCVFRLDRPAENERDAAVVVNLLGRTFKSENLTGECYMVEKEYFVCIFDMKTKVSEYQKTLMSQLLLFSQSNMEKHTAYTVADSMAAVAENLQGLREKLTDTLAVLRTRHYYRAPQILTWVPVPQTSVSALSGSMVRQLSVGNYQSALEMMNEYVDQAHEAFWDPMQLKQAVSYVVTLLHSFQDQISASERSLRDYSRLVEKIREAPDMLCLKKVLGDFSDAYLQTVGNTVQLTPSIQRVIEYVNENYRNKLTLESIAEHVYLNKTYLSQLFTKQMNMSLGTYIENTRIKVAKNLLATTSMSISDIAEATGYSTQSYFTKVFKKTVGISAMKYRSMFSKDAAPEGGTDI